MFKEIQKNIKGFHMGFNDLVGMRKDMVRSLSDVRAPLWLLEAGPK